MRLTATLPAARPAALMATAARHFAHKVAVTMDETPRAWASPAVSARLRVTAAGLHLSIESRDPEGAQRRRDVPERHLLRFAQREGPAPLVWARG